MHFYVIVLCRWWQIGWNNGQRQVNTMGKMTRNHWQSEFRNTTEIYGLLLLKAPPITEQAYCRRKPVVAGVAHRWHCVTNLYSRLQGRECKRMCSWKIFFFKIKMSLYVHNFLWANQKWSVENCFKFVYRLTTHIAYSCCHALICDAPSFVVRGWRGPWRIKYMA